METTWQNAFTVTSTCVLSAWRHGVTEPEDPKEPLVSSFSFWHWLLDICHHLILYYSINNPPPLSSLLAPNLLWQLIMLQVLRVASVLYSFQHCLHLRYAIIFITSDHYTVHYTASPTPHPPPSITTCVLIREVTRSPSVLVCRAVINVFMVWSKCRYLQQLGPSVIFFLWHPWT